MRESSELEIIRRIFNDDGFEIGYERVESIEEHDKKVREAAIDEFAKLIHEDLYQLNHHQVDFLSEQLKEQSNE